MVATAIPVAAIIGAAAVKAGGDIMSAVQSNKSAESINDRQIRWNERLARNAHQWEVEDLQKAGLNPVLSAGGSGASAPGISPVMPDTSGYGRAGSSIMSAIMDIYDAKVKDETAKNIAADTKNKEQDTQNKKDLGENIKSQTELNKKQLSFMATQMREIESRIQRNNVLNSKDKAEIAKIGHEITKIDTDIELNKAIKELTAEKKELIKEEEVLTVIKQKQGIETYKAQIMDNKLKSVRVKMRYIDEYLNKCQTIMKLGTGLLDSVIPG